MIVPTSQPPLWLPYCGAAPEPAGWLAQWNLDLLLLIGLALCALACALRPSVERPWQASAIALFALLYVSPLCPLGSSLFIVRVVHHVALMAGLAPLLVGAFALHRARIPLSLPVLTGLQAMTFWAWHAPPLYEAALSSDAAFWLMQITITGSAALWWAKLRQAPAGVAVIALLATMVVMGALGALLTFAGRAFYAPHYLTTQAWGLSPLEDQQIAGILMWAPASAIYLLAAMFILYRSLGEPATQAARA